MNSKFVQLKEYLLLEFTYTSLVDPDKINTSNYGWSKIDNGYFNTSQIFNSDNAETITGNVQDRSVVQISNNTFAHLDIDRINNYLNIDSNLTNKNDIPISFSPNLDIPYDTIKFHFLSGYNFEDIDGVILQVLAKESSGKDLTLSQIAVLKSENIFALNPKPIFLGDRLYDKYIEVKIPSLKIIIDEYLSLDGSPAQGDTFVAKITSNGNGLVKNHPIQIKAININSSETEDRQLYFNIGQESVVSIKPVDEFALFQAVVRESDEGDYFEYFGSFNGGFAEDFIANLNNMGNSYIMIHELEVKEQINSNFISTDNFASIQSRGYDSPNYFRPIIKNSDIAISFTIDYQLRLLNKKDNSQVVRRSSLSSFNVSKWGRELQKITLKNAPDVTNIFNKITKGTTIQNNIVEDSINQNKVQTRFIPSFFDKKLISIRRETLFIDTQGQLVSSKGDGDKIIFPQGQAQVIIDPFDTFVKIIIFSADNRDNSPIPMDLGNNAKYNFVLLDNDLNKIYIKQEINVNFADQTRGELLFKIPSNIGIKMRDFSNRDFFIISIDNNGIESKIYQGQIKTPTEFELAREKEIILEQKENTESDARILELQNKLEKSRLELQRAQLLQKSQGIDPARVSLKASKTQGGAITPGGFLVNKIDVPGLVTNQVTRNPIQLIQPSEKVINSKSDKFQKDRNEKKIKTDFNRRNRNLDNI